MTCLKILTSYVERVERHKKIYTTWVEKYYWRQKEFEKKKKTWKLRNSTWVFIRKDRKKMTTLMKNGKGIEWEQ